MIELMIQVFIEAGMTYSSQHNQLTAVLLCLWRLSHLLPSVKDKVSLSQPLPAYPLLGWVVRESFQKKVLDKKIENRKLKSSPKDQNDLRGIRRLQATRGGNFDLLEKRMSIVETSKSYRNGAQVRFGCATLRERESWMWVASGIFIEVFTEGACCVHCQIQQAVLCVAVCCSVLQCVYGRRYCVHCQMQQAKLCCALFVAVCCSVFTEGAAASTARCSRLQKHAHSANESYPAAGFQCTCRPGARVFGECLLFPCPVVKPLLAGTCSGEAPPSLRPAMSSWQWYHIYIDHMRQMWDMDHSLNHSLNHSSNHSYVWHDSFICMPFIESFIRWAPLSLWGGYD